MSSIATRRRLVRQLVSSGRVESQQEIVAMLEEQGLYVTQATVSRDLDAIGAVRVRRDGGGHHYEIHDDPPGVGTGDREALRIIDDFADSMVVSGNLLVIRTRPGAAHVVASAIDGARIDGVLGTVAGDDTLFVVADEDTGGRGIADALSTRGVQP